MTLTTVSISPAKAKKIRRAVMELRPELANNVYMEISPDFNANYVGAMAGGISLGQKEIRHSKEYFGKHHQLQTDHDHTFTVIVWNYNGQKHITEVIVNEQAC